MAIVILYENRAEDFLVIETLQSATSQNHLQFAEFFAGIGLVRKGLEQVGFKCVFANDIDKIKGEIYARNFGNAHLQIDDIASWSLCFWGCCCSACCRLAWSRNQAPFSSQLAAFYLVESGRKNRCCTRLIHGELIRPRTIP